MDMKKEIKLSGLVRRPSTRQRKQEIVGLKIGASQVAASRVVNDGGQAKLVQLARVPLEPGVVVAGEVRDIPALSSALAELFRTHKLPRRGVHLGVATNRIGVRSFELEGIEGERQLANAIRFRAHEELSIPPDEAVLDYHVVSEGVNEAGQHVCRVVLAAAYRDSIDRYVAACEQAGIEVAAVDLEAFALLRAVAPASERDEPGRSRRGDDRPRPHDPRDLRRHRLRLHARRRVGRRESRGRDRARPRPERRRGRRS